MAQCPVREVLGVRGLDRRRDCGRQQARQLGQDYRRSLAVIGRGVPTGDLQSAKIEVGQRIRDGLRRFDAKRGALRKWPGNGCRYRATVTVEVILRPPTLRHVEAAGAMRWIQWTN